MAAIDGGLAAPRPAAQLPAAIADLISTEAYLQARDGGGRRRPAGDRDRPRAGRAVRCRPDTIGMIGFSAGAFLAVDVALDPRAEPLAFVGADLRRRDARRDRAGGRPAAVHRRRPGRPAVKIVEGLHADWSDADRPSELHVFARGGHGFGMVRQGMPSDRWTDLFLAWLDDLGSASHQPT